MSTAERAFVSRSTYTKLEKGDPTVSMGACVTVLAILELVEAPVAVFERVNANKPESESRRRDDGVKLAGAITIKGD